MKNRNRGFIPILLAIIISLGIGGGATYVATKNKKVENDFVSESSLINTASSSMNTDEEVDVATNTDSLVSETENDIKSDLASTPKLQVKQPNVSAQAQVVTTTTVAPVQTPSTSLVDQYGMTEADWKRYDQSIPILREQNKIHNKDINSFPKSFLEKTKVTRDYFLLASAYAQSGSVMSNRIDAGLDALQEVEQKMWQHISKIENLVKVNEEIISLIQNRNGSSQLTLKMEKSLALSEEIGSEAESLAYELIQAMGIASEVRSILGI